MLEDFTDESFEKLHGFVNSDLNPVKYLSIDPGESNGICGYDSRFYLQFMVVVPEKHISRFIKQFEKLHTCVIEDYRLFPNKAMQQVYSSMTTTRVLGRVENWTENNDIKLVKQQPSIKLTAYKWLGKKPLPKSNPMNHAYDAHVHFIYWGVRTERIDASSLVKKSTK